MPSSGKKNNKEKMNNTSTIEQIKTLGKINESNKYACVKECASVAHPIAKNIYKKYFDMFFYLPHSPVNFPYKIIMPLKLHPYKNAPYTTQKSNTTAIQSILCFLTAC